MARDLKSLVGAGSARELQEKLENWHQEYEVGAGAPGPGRPPPGVAVAGLGPVPRPCGWRPSHTSECQPRLFASLPMARLPENKGRRLKVRFEAHWL